MTTQLSYSQIVYQANKNGIRVYTAQSDKDKDKSGLHLVKPSMKTLLLAVDDALIKGLNAIYIHNKR